VTALRADVVTKEIEASLDLADEGLVGMFLQSQRVEHPIDELHRFPEVGRWPKLICIEVNLVAEQLMPFYDEWR